MQKHHGSLTDQLQLLAVRTCVLIFKKQNAKIQRKKHKKFNNSFVFT